MKKTTKFIALGLLSCSCLTGCFGKTSSKKKGSSKTQVSFSEWKALAEACPYNEMKTAEAKFDAVGERPNLVSYKIKGTRYYEYAEGKWSMTREEVEGSGFDLDESLPGYVGMKMIDFVSVIEPNMMIHGYTFKFYADLTMDCKADIVSVGVGVVKGTARVAFDSNGFLSFMEEEEGVIDGTGKAKFHAAITYFA